MANQRRKLTKARMEANRRNARKSTGPRTPAGKRRAALNSLQHGRYASPSVRPMLDTMTALGEEPHHFRELLEDVLESYPPQNPLQVRIAEEIAGLLWQLERNHQAQEGKLLRTMEKLEMDRHLRLKQITTRTSYDALQAEVLETGLRRAPNSPAKFSELNACLERLSHRVEQGNFDDETELQALYGKSPTFLGAGIVNAFRALAKTPEGAELDPALYAGLRMMLAEEVRNVNEEYQFYFREYIDISRAMRQECRAPTQDPEYLRLKREEVRSRRQLERTIQLYLRMQREAGAGRARRRWSERLEQFFSPEPVSEPGGMRARPGAPRVSPAALQATPVAPEAAEVSLRHKLVRLEDSSPTDTRKPLSEDVIRKIREVYGLDPDPTPPSPERSGGGEKPEPAEGGEGRSGREADGEEKIG